jgi:hypothetical protein
LKIPAGPWFTLGIIAARTTILEIASGILLVYSRPPALTAMTAPSWTSSLDDRFQGVQWS